MIWFFHLYKTTEENDVVLVDMIWFSHLYKTTSFLYLPHLALGIVIHSEALGQPHLCVCLHEFTAMFFGEFILYFVIINVSDGGSCSSFVKIYMIPFSHHAPTTILYFHVSLFHFHIKSIISKFFKSHFISLNI